MAYASDRGQGGGLTGRTAPLPPPPERLEGRHVDLHDGHFDEPRDPVARPGQANDDALDPRPQGGADEVRTEQPIVMLTAYTMRMAQLLDPHCDMLLVGDSLGQVIYGLPRPSR